MSELQLDDDPDPQPITHDFTAVVAEHELTRLDEHEMIVMLSNRASELLESDIAKGKQTERRVAVQVGELSRRIEEGAWTFSFADTLEGRRRCRSWKLGSASVNWCRDERRHEPAAEVLERIEAVFTPQDVEKTKDSRPKTGSRLRRALATFAIFS